MLIQLLVIIGKRKHPTGTQEEKILLNRKLKRKKLKEDDF